MLNFRATSLDLEPALRDFEARGFARLGVIMEADAVTELQRVANALMCGDLCYPGLFFQHDSATGEYGDLCYRKGWIGPSSAYRKLEGLERDPCFLSWIENPLFGRIARSVLGPDVALYRAVLWNKAAQGGTELPWHQDDGKFWGIDRRPSLQIWTALDDVAHDAGCVEVVPGTHLAGLASAEGGTVTHAHAEAVNADREAVKLTARAGEAILLHNHLWHRSGRNTTASARRAFSVSYLDGATRCTRKRRAPRHFMRLFSDSQSTID